MPTIKAQDCMDKAEIILQDTSNGRFGETELLGWFNDGERAVVGLKPDAYVKEEAVTLIAGINQSIPTTGMALIGLSHNMGVGGETQGDIIRLISRAHLDAQQPSWPTDTGSATVLFYMFDDRKPRIFQVYPKQPAVSMGSAWMTYTDTPADIAKTDVILLADIYAIPIQHYIVAMALAKDPAYSGVAAHHMGIFNSALGVKEKAEMQADPNIRVKG